MVRAMVRSARVLLVAAAASLLGALATHADTASPAPDRYPELERKVEVLKGRLARPNAPLGKLKETVDQGGGAPRAVIRHHNGVGPGLRLVRAVYLVDESPVFTQADERGRLDEATEYAIFDGDIVPGRHTLKVLLEYQGDGGSGHRKGQHFRVRRSYTFNTREGRRTELTVNATEKATSGLAIDFQLK
jgi:hypothetical protein